MTGGQVHDVNLLDELLLEPGAFYLLDRGYVDFARLHLFTQACAFFVTRAKKNLQFYLRTSRPVDRSSGLRCDQIIRLTGIRTAQRYPDTLRRIVYFDAEKESRLTFLTNNFSLLPLAIAKKQLGLDMSLYQILEILSVTIFEKNPILEGLSGFNDQSPDVDPGIQLNLFDGCAT